MTLKQQYRVRANKIGDNAVRLVSDFFGRGIYNSIRHHESEMVIYGPSLRWTLSDLDRALDEMEKQKSPA